MQTTPQGRYREIRISDNSVVTYTNIIKLKDIRKILFRHHNEDYVYIGHGYPRNLNEYCQLSYSGDTKIYVLSPFCVAGLEQILPNCLQKGKVYKVPERLSIIVRFQLETLRKSDIPNEQQY